MDRLLLTAAALAFLGVSLAMILFERARNRTSPFPATEGGRVSYWMSYLFLIVLGLTFLIKAAAV
jgi:4-amino-4-deoxy-L-arabinose transferase-like glycosyltransferase